MTYICSCCNRRFEEPTTQRGEREYRANYGGADRELACPYCGGGYEEEEEIYCAECGAKILDGEICEDCQEEIELEIGELLASVSERARRAIFDEENRRCDYLRGCYRQYVKREAGQK